MKKNIYFSLIIAVCFWASSCSSIESPDGAVKSNTLDRTDTVDLTETMKESLVYLQISHSSYDLYQPWKRTPTSKDSGFGCAVGPYEILTTAENIINASLIKVRRYGQNEFIPATVKIVDYECNLCLLELDQQSVDTPLNPLSFKELFPKGKQLTAYWLSSGNHLTTARSTLDRAEMSHSIISFVQNLTFFATNVSRPFGDGEVCAYNDSLIGIAAWGTESDSGIIPSETIDKFLSHCNIDGYSGFGAEGFETYSLLDPAMRTYLKMPADLKHGVYVSTVHSIGTGSDELKSSDVILSMDGKSLNPYGRYEHPDYGRISFRHIISQTPNGDKIPVEIFRDGKIESLEITSIAIESDNMLIPYYIYGNQPEYVVLSGFVFQQLTRDYLALWGSDFSGKVPPHLYNYYVHHLFKPTDEREDIVILSYVLPAEVNQGYQQLSRIVVDSVNGVKIKSMKDVLQAVKNTSDSDFIEVTFEMDTPAVVIPKEHLNTSNAQIAQMYGIPQLMNIKE